MTKFKPRGSLLETVLDVKRKAVPSSDGTASSKLLFIQSSNTSINLRVDNVGSFDIVD